MSTLLFADVAQRVGNTIIQILAVAGAATVGYFLVRGLTWLICRATIQKQPPKQVSHILGIVGAVAVGAAAFFLLFYGDGGGGFGFGPGGGWFGAGSGKAEIGSTQTSTQRKSEPPTDPPTPKTPSKIPAKSQFAVRVLGGTDVVDEKFFRIDGEQAALTLADVQKAIRDRKAANKDSIQEIVILVYPDSVARDHEKVLALKNFGVNEGLLVSIPENPEKR